MGGTRRKDDEEDDHEEDNDLNPLSVNEEFTIGSLCPVPQCPNLMVYLGLMMPVTYFSIAPSLCLIKDVMPWTGETSDGIWYASNIGGTAVSNRFVNASGTGTMSAIFFLPCLFLWLEFLDFRKRLQASNRFLPESVLSETVRVEVVEGDSPSRSSRSPIRNPARSRNSTPRNKTVIERTPQNKTPRRRSNSRMSSLRNRTNTNTGVSCLSREAILGLHYWTIVIYQVCWGLFLAHPNDVFPLMHGISAGLNTAAMFFYTYFRTIVEWNWIVVGWMTTSLIQVPLFIILLPAEEQDYIEIPGFVSALVPGIGNLPGMVTENTLSGIGSLPGIGTKVKISKWYWKEETHAFYITECNGMLLASLIPACYILSRPFYCNKRCVKRARQEGTCIKRQYRNHSMFELVCGKRRVPRDGAITAHKEALSDVTTFTTAECLYRSLRRWLYSSGEYKKTS